MGPLCLGDPGPFIEDLTPTERKALRLWLLLCPTPQGAGSYSTPQAPSHFAYGSAFCSIHSSQFNQCFPEMSSVTSDLRSVYFSVQALEKPPSITCQVVD